MGLLAYRDGIVNIAPLQEDTFAGKIKATRTEGAVIALRAMTGISVPWLERVNLCHAALVGSGRCWPPDLSKTDDRIVLAMLTRF
jgi:hypothetical protein